MNSTSSSLEHGNPILGVFAYLDALPRESIPKIDGLRGMLFPGNAEEMERNEIADLIGRTFRLQWRECPLRPTLAKYHLYHRDDMADALAAAYCLHKRGANPIDALTADYCLKFHGILTWEDLDKIKAELTWETPRATWGRLSPFYEPGDRLIRYQTMGSCGLLLVRGDRLVWDCEEIHLCKSPSLRWETDRDHFMALGGNRGFLAGDFVWPPPDWVNPVTDEEQDEHMKKGYKFTKPIESAP